MLASCTISVYTWYGGTHHVFDLQPTQVSKSLEWNVISLAFCIGAISSGKVSVALLIYRLQAPSKWRTWLLGFLSVSSVIVAILIVVLEYAQCKPVQKLWVPTLRGSCWNAESVNDWDITGSCKMIPLFVPFCSMLTLLLRLLGFRRFSSGFDPSDVSMEPPTATEKEDNVVCVVRVRCFVSGLFCDW